MVDISQEWRRREGNAELPKDFGSQERRIINPKYQEACEKLLADVDVNDNEKYQSVKKFLNGEIDSHPDFKFEGKKWLVERESRFINVFCVITGNKYSLDYVRRLRNMVNKNLTIPHKFICLTDRANYYAGQEDVEGIEFRPAFITMPDSWCKLSLFHYWLNDYGYKGKALYFDLDVVIVDNIDKLVANDKIDKIEVRKVENNQGIFKDVEFEKATFSIIKDWTRPTYNSSMMIWEIGDYNYLHNRFRAYDIRKVDGRNRGDQDLITELLNEKGINVHTFSPKEVKSYKCNNLHRGFVKPTKIVVFHGKPKPHEFKDKKCWVNKYWV